MGKAIAFVIDLILLTVAAPVTYEMGRTVVQTAGLAEQAQVHSLSLGQINRMQGVKRQIPPNALIGSVRTWGAAINLVLVNGRQFSTRLLDCKLTSRCRSRQCIFE